MSNEVTPNPREAQNEARLKREAVKETVEALRTKVEGGVERLDGIGDRVRGSMRTSDALVRRHPWIGVSFTLGLGFALGRRRPRVEVSERQTIVVGEPRSSLVRTALGLAARALAPSAMALVRSAIEDNEATRQR